MPPMYSSIFTVRSDGFHCDQTSGLRFIQSHAISSTSGSSSCRSLYKCNMALYSSWVKKTRCKAYKKNKMCFFFNKDNVHCSISVFYCSRQVRADGQHQSKDKASACFFCAFSWIILHQNKIECLREMFSILYYTVFFLLELLAKLSSHCYKKEGR